MKFAQGAGHRAQGTDRAQGIDSAQGSGHRAQGSDSAQGSGSRARALIPPEFSPPAKGECP
jgi:hypothetical protein